MRENPETDPPMALMATDGIALYPSLERHETVIGTKKFIETIIGPRPPAKISTLKILSKEN